MPRERRVIVLGSTGSIGTQALDVIAHLNRLHARGEWPERLRIVGLAAGTNAALLERQAAETGADRLALAEGEGLQAGRARVQARGLYRTAERLVREVECDLVVAAIVGVAGLPATLAAVELGRDVALANKETLVAAGELVVAEAARSGSRLLPVDSEHSGVWQCLAGLTEAAPPFPAPAGVGRVILTASGGPFRQWSRERIASAGPADALNHPTWSMGPKNTIDSASLMNKALEVVEAHWLFGLAPERIGVLVHPQSVVHSMVELSDGSVLAQLGAPDMRAPIQHALTHPRRAPSPAPPIDWREAARLEFAEPDLERFPALRLGYEAIARGGTAGAILNAANEEAVGAFLAGRIPFGRIADLAAAAMDGIEPRPARRLDEVHQADAMARRLVLAAV